VSLGAQYKLVKEFIDKYSGLSSSLALHLAYGSDAANILGKKEAKADDSDID